MDREDLLHGFDFKDNSIGDQEIYLISSVDLDAGVTDWHRNLSVEWEALPGQLICEASLVDRLQEPGSEGPVNRYRCAEDRLRQLIQLLCGASVSSASQRFKGILIEVSHERSLSPCPDTLRTKPCLLGSGSRWVKVM